MKEIIVTTPSNFEKKGREITRLFLDVNPRMTEHPPFLPRVSPTFRYIQPDFYPTFRYMDNNPPNYPNGIRLVLKKKCPYCETEKVYAERSWQTPSDAPIRRGTFSLFVGGGDPNYGRALEEIRNLNPGICSDCESATYKSSRETGG